MTPSKTPLADAAALLAISAIRNDGTAFQISEIITRHTRADEMRELLGQWLEYHVYHLRGCERIVADVPCTCLFGKTETLLEKIG